MTEKRRKRNLLKLGSVDMISLVDAGDNPEAHVMIHKRSADKGSILDEEEGGTMPGVNTNDDDRIGLAKRLLKYLAIGKDDLDLEEEVIVDKDAQELKKQLDELQEKFDDLGKETATAKSINTANDEIAKAKSAEEVDKVIAALEDVDVIKAVTDTATARKGELVKSADDEVVKAFRDKLPNEALQKAFDGMDDDDQKSFMKSYGGSEEDPLAKTVSKLAGENDDLRTRLEKVEQREEEAVIEKDLEALEGVIKSIPDTAATIAKLRKSNPDAADAMLVEYKALAKQAEEKGFLKVLGQDDGVTGDAEEAIEKAVEKHMAAHPDVTKEAAEAAVLDANPALYDAYNDEKEAG